MLPILGCVGFAGLVLALWLAGRIARRLPSQPKRLTPWDGDSVGGTRK